MTKPKDNKTLVYIGFTGILLTLMAFVIGNMLWDVALVPEEEQWKIGYKWLYQKSPAQKDHLRFISYILAIIGFLMGASVTLLRRDYWLIGLICTLLLCLSFVPQLLVVILVLFVLGFLLYTLFLMIKK